MAQLPNIVIRNSGVYKFSKTDKEMKMTSAVYEEKFVPQDFLDARSRR